jgi:CheY-like chemotaxis protein
MQKSILLIEDDELDVISVQRSLKRLELDYMLYTAYNGVEALAMLRDGNEESLETLPDIILLDLNMPKMNGIEFLKELRTDPKLKDIKVFIMTTSGEEYDRSITADLGVSGYIIKPLNSDNTKNISSMDNFMQFFMQKIFAQ